MENKIEEKKNIENLEKIREVLNEYNPDLLKEDIIRDNCLEFSALEKIYRVRMPSNREKNEADRYKHKTYIRLLKDDSYMLRSQLIKLLKEEKNVDIDELDYQIQELNDQINNIYEKMATIKSENNKDIESLKGKVTKKFNQIQKISIQKAEYLAFCIEEEVYTQYLQYITLKCTEKLVPSSKTGEEEKWQQVWITQEEYDNDNNNILADKAILNITKLFQMTRIF